MKIENLDLHGLNQLEARNKIQQNIDWLLQHNGDILVINHGKGYHSSNNFAVLKTETRKYLKENTDLAEAGYLIIYGESDFPVALSYDEGNTLIVLKGMEREYIGGRARQEKNMRIFSEDGRDARKNSKNIRKQKKRR
jgi:hypothetical protein